jgi:hypothetical protein
MFDLPLWTLDTNIFVLDDLNFDYNDASAKTSTTASAKTMEADLEGPPTPPGDGGNTNSNNALPQVSDLPDFGTNLFFANLGMVSGNLTGIASNTTADVEYFIQTNSDLTMTNNWADEGQFILGSETTNWTQFILPPPLSTNNLFFRLQSELSSDGSGIPNWWEIKFFGTNGVNPNALDSAGDGWTIYQKYEMGVAPNQFVTPAAPQGLTLQVDDSTGTEVSLSWQACNGNVSGYTVQAIENGEVNYPVTLGTTSASQTNFSTTLTFTYFGTAEAAPGFRVIAQYTNGVSSEPSAIVNMETDSELEIQIIPDSGGQPELAVGTLPPDAVSILLSNGSTSYIVAVSNLVV